MDWVLVDEDNCTEIIASITVSENSDCTCNVEAVCKKIGYTCRFEHLNKDKLKTVVSSLKKTVRYEINHLRPENQKPTEKKIYKMIDGIPMWKHIEVTASAKDKKTYTVLPCKIDVTIVRPVMCGSLYRVKIVPGVTAVSVNKQKMLRAIAEDMKGNVVNKKVTYSWKIVHDTSKGSKINNESGEAIIFTAGKIIGQVKLHLIVQQASQQGVITKEDFAIIDIKEVKRVAKSKRNLLGLPVSQPITHLEYPIWHSRLDMKEKVLYYNVAHRDYTEVQSDEAKRQRYIANLYAKELALLECRNLGIDNYGERLVEVMSKLDKYWKL